MDESVMKLMQNLIHLRGDVHKKVLISSNEGELLFCYFHHSTLNNNLIHQHL